MTRISTLIIPILSLSAGCASQIEPGEYSVELRLESPDDTGCPAPTPIQNLDGWQCPLGSYDVLNPQLVAGFGPGPASCPEVLELGTHTWEAVGDDYVTFNDLSSGHVMSGPTLGGGTVDARVESAYLTAGGLRSFTWQAFVWPEGGGFVGGLDVQLRLESGPCSLTYDVSATPN